MKMVIRDIRSPDVRDLATWEPDDPSDFMVLVEVSAGRIDGPGEELFGIEVATPAFLAGEISRRGPLFGRHFLFVERWEWPRIEATIREYVDGLTGETWSELAGKLGRIGRWEFEDYRP